MNRRNFLSTSAAAVGATALAQSTSADGATPVSASPLPAPLPANLSRLFSLDDVEAAARTVMVPAVYEYISGGSADELTIRWNREKYRDLRLNPRALIDVSKDRKICEALALGASAVQVGRPYVYGLAVGGAEGVAHVVKILRKELLQSMALLGRPTLASIDRTVLWE